MGRAGGDQGVEVQEGVISAASPCDDGTVVRRDANQVGPQIVQRTDVMNPDARGFLAT
jgi:hypothetical protein